MRSLILALALTLGASAANRFAFTTFAMPRMKLGSPMPIDTVRPSAVKRPQVKSSAS